MGHSQRRSTSAAFYADGCDKSSFDVSYSYEHRSCDQRGSPLQNPRTGENRAVEIYMNSPLRYDGLTFYQYQMTAGEMAVQAGETPSSVLQVVHNPSWLTPYVGCGMVAVGLVVQFMFHLVGFITKRKTP